MRSMLFRFAVFFSMVMVVAPDILPFLEPTTAEAAPRRRGRRVSRSQANRARQARARQQRNVRNQQLARLNRNRQAAQYRARMNAYARLNPNRFGPGGLTTPANTPSVVNKDVHFQMSEKLTVGSLIPNGRKHTFEDIAVGQTITVTVFREKADANDPAKTTQSLLGDVTGKVIEVKNNTTLKELVLRLSTYHYGAAKDEVIQIVPGQYVTSAVIRTQPQGVAGLFKQ